MSILERQAIATAATLGDALTPYVSRYPAMPGSTVEQRAQFAVLVERLTGGVA
jgi:hypothetical protein